MTAKFSRISLNYKALSFDDFFFMVDITWYLFYSASHLLVWVTPCFQRKDWVWIRVYPLLLQVHCSYRYTVTIKLLIIYLFPWGGGGRHKICKNFCLGFLFLFFFLQFKMFIMAITTGYNICRIVFFAIWKWSQKKAKIRSLRK